MFEKSDINLELFEDTFEMFSSKDYREYVAGVNVGWLCGARNWKSFITLTFQDDVSPEHGMGLLKGLIKELNKEVFGNSYSRIVGHSYFSYVVGIEHTQNGVIHYHLIVDRPIDWAECIYYWHTRAGYCMVEPIIDHSKAVAYVTKYSTKGGETLIYFAKRFYYPETMPGWWSECPDQVYQWNNKIGNYKIN